MYTLKRIDNIFKFKIESNRDLWYFHRNFFSNLSPEIERDTKYYLEEMDDSLSTDIMEIIIKVLIPVGLAVFLFIFSSCLYLSLDNAQCKRMKLLPSVGYKQLDVAENSAAQFITEMVIYLLIYIYIYT